VVHRPTGLVFAPARVYSPRLRQWLTRDPAGERDAVDGRNLYAYVAGDPVNRVDPTGEWIVPLVAGVVGFGLGYYWSHRANEQQEAAWTGNIGASAGDAATIATMQERLFANRGDYQRTWEALVYERQHSPPSVANRPDLVNVDHYLQNYLPARDFGPVGLLGSYIDTRIYYMKKARGGVLSDSEVGNAASAYSSEAHRWAMRGLIDASCGRSRFGDMSH
jgi:RHS repeat-associated protein